MSKNYFRLYRQMFKVVEAYQDVVVPQLRAERDRLKAENEVLSRRNTELGTQMRQMVAKQCACDCAWRQEGGE